MLMPGILVAATGIGVGDLASAGFAGSKLGYTVLWAVVAGAFFKFVINEGLARWQLATGQTLLEGAVLRFGRAVQWFFLVYLLIWSWAVGSALINACGLAGHALFPVFGDAHTGKIFWGIAHSLVAVVLVRLGGFQLFEKAMAATLIMTFASVIATALASRPDWSGIVGGLMVPRIATDRAPDAAQWTLVVMGGVGGTLTMLCYGYWIREQGRRGPEFLRTCRIDLAVSYTMTAVFGIAVVIIGSGLDLTEGRGAGFILKLADRLGEVLGRPMKWIFLVGAWATIFNSLLGVWQAVPYLFADFWRLFRARAGNAPAVDMRSGVYTVYLLALATIPMLGLWFSFVTIQKAYSLLGAVVMPMIALTLLILNGRRDLVGNAYRNHPATIAILVGVLLFFIYAAYLTITTGRDVVS